MQYNHRRFSEAAKPHLFVHGVREDFSFLMILTHFAMQGNSTGDLLNTNDADTPYDEDSKTRDSETSPPCCPADNNNEEKTEQ